MGSGMNVEQAKEYAKTMTYRQAISNVGSGKFIKYRKATMIKFRELAEIADGLVTCQECRKRMTGDCPMCNGCKLERIPTEDNDFCSYGERSER